MMNPLRIAADEWRLWYRSRLAMVGLAAVIGLLAGTATITALRVHTESKDRTEGQVQADEHFLTQPDRHPHRMIHYGHYVFRTPAPLAIFDPGIDALTGDAIFLEGHRQNSATFASAQASTNLGGFGALTPALMYQLFVPLLLIAFGHSVILRERELGTLPTLLAQGLSTSTLVAGKMLALVGLITLLLLPALLVLFFALANGASAIVSLTVVLSYALYLLVWAAIIMLASLTSRHRSWALGVLLGIWFSWTLLIPRLGATITRLRIPTAGKIEMDLLMQEDIRRAGDGHNATDPAFVNIRTELLAQHNVERVEDLPVNIRGVVAEASEAALTTIMNRYANTRMRLEVSQAKAVTSFGWLSPPLALSAASQTLAGTDLATHHRFLREAEKLRLDFVQGLNRIHAQQLRYQDDIDRSRNTEAEKRTRVSAESWSLLKKFSFSRAQANDRISVAFRYWMMLIAWVAGIAVACGLATRRLAP
ncbi:MAG: DUF3526 domain-containing protein [Myxococcales bacterium]|nr:DUF3526 domain-containing protein [Myxococcales bacterium]